jgi:hypothetical protein
MKKQRRFFGREEGQSIVIIAIVMVAMLALAGLAIDGGNLFLERRNTQNAADAAALAGTRVLAKAVCSQPDADDSAVLEAVNQFAERNGVEDVSFLFAEYTDQEQNVLGEVGAGTIPVGASGVQVDIDNTINTHFMKVVGIDTADVSADALALTGPLMAGGGVRPIGIPKELVWDWEKGVDPPEFHFVMKNCATKPEECIVYYTGEDGEDVQSQHRGWLNLGYMWNDGTTPPPEYPDWPRAKDPNTDANTLKDWMANGCQDCPPLWAGDYIHAKPGTNSSAVGAAPLVGTIILPIFDWVPHYDEIDDDFKPPKAAQGGGYYYHIVGFLAYKVTKTTQGKGLIEGEIVEVIQGNGQVGYGKYIGFGEGDACRTHAQAVNLWR